MNNDYNKEKYKQIAIRISPTEADEIKAKATETRLSIARLIVLSVRAYQPTGAGEDQPHTTGDTSTPTTPTAGATETHPDERQDSQPDYIRQDENAPQRAAENARELTHSPTGKYYPAQRDYTKNGSESENTPGQVRIYTETDLKQAIQEAAQQAAQKAARQARQEIKREMKMQAIQAAGMTIGSARRAKAATVSGLMPVRIRHPKK